jgi:hypothetical protein
MSTTVSQTNATRTDDGYAELEELLAIRVQCHQGPLFTTSVDPKVLWGHFLHHLPEDKRQHYNCHACRHFVERFGGLARVEAGHARSLLWDPVGVPEFFLPAVASVRLLVENAKINGVFVSSARTWGTPTTRDPKKGCTWTHLHGRQNPSRIFSSKAKTDEQEMAEKREEHAMLRRALADYPRQLAREAVRVLRSGTLARSEKALAIAEWFEEAHAKTNDELWLAVATAPAGFCHVRSTVISTLLEDLRQGLDFETVSRRWGEKLDPLAYQRPKAAPTEGQISAAEKLVEKLGCVPALERRFATLADVRVKLWSPCPEKEAPAEGGVFGHLRGKKEQVRKLELPPVKVTWEKFAREVLPKARSLEASLPARGGFYGLTAPVHADAPNLLQWDDPVSWYFYKDGSAPHRWGLSGQRARVTAVFLAPHQWSEPGRRFTNHRRIAFFALEGARDRFASEAGLAIFPENLRSEFHPIRATIEAHSGKGTLAGVEAGDANGIAFQDQGAALQVRVDGEASYVIDRWN